MSKIKNDGLDQYGTVYGLNGIGGERVKRKRGSKIERWWTYRMLYLKVTRLRLSSADEFFVSCFVNSIDYCAFVFPASAPYVPPPYETDSIQKDHSVEQDKPIPW